MGQTEQNTSDYSRSTRRTPCGQSTFVKFTHHGNEPGQDRWSGFIVEHDELYSWSQLGTPLPLPPPNRPVVLDMLNKGPVVDVPSIISPKYIVISDRFKQLLDAEVPGQLQFIPIDDVRYKAVPRSKDTGFPIKAVTSQQSLAMGKSLGTRQYWIMHCLRNAHALNYFATEVRWVDEQRRMWDCSTFFMEGKPLAPELVHPDFAVVFFGTNILMRRWLHDKINAAGITGIYWYDTFEVAFDLNRRWIGSVDNILP